MRNVNSVIIIFLAVISLLLLALCYAATAHDDPVNWIGIEKRKNKIGEMCCGNDDCVRYEKDQVKVMPDGYHFPDGEVIAFNKVSPSVDRWYWKCHWGGEVKCTFAPLGAS